ncbi:MAG: acyloxyacyl hydrolase [Pseudomonadota bacterium]
MGKSSKSLFIGAIASALMASTAYSADLIPPPVVEFEPEYEVGGNLYLRGFVGFSNQHVDELDSPTYRALAGTGRYEVLNQSFESGGIAGLGIGYRVNEYFRADITAEYRMRTGFHGLDRIGDTPTTWDRTNQYDANKSEYVFLANAFLDAPSYHGISPYVGAGIGASYTMITEFVDSNPANPGVAYASDNGEWAFAWALYAGLGYEVSENLTLDFGYRYLHLGDAESGDLIDYDGTNLSFNPLEFNGLSSHDFTLGLRWNFGEFGHSSSGYGHGGHASYGHISY